MNIRRVDMTSLQGACQKRVSEVKSEESKKIDFDEILNRESLGVKFSKHAVERMESRNMGLSESQLAKVESAIRRAKEKGVKETLVLVEDMAFIASTKSETIITAVPKADIEGNVFTNIDGAVII